MSCFCGWGWKTRIENRAKINIHVPHERNIKDVDKQIDINNYSEKWLFAGILLSTDTFRGTLTRKALS